MRGWVSLVAGCGETPSLSQGATLTERWIYELQPTTNHRMRVGVSHLEEQYRLGGCQFLSLDCSTCACVDIFPTRGTLWSPGANGSISLSLTLMSTSGRGFKTVRGDVDSGDRHLSPR